jgi:hypothetical protein
MIWQKISWVPKDRKNGTLFSRFGHLYSRDKREIGETVQNYQIPTKIVIKMVLSLPAI